ncbi:hypothetical protein K456DRAFT_1040466 [Colletotrichum gloeosporioides 23]|nr:hypothetical protein K456DRAFT_1040466 [Colletotrichum gloeosporioides 23]
MVGRSLAPGEISCAGMPSPTPRHRRPAPVYPQPLQTTEPDPIRWPSTAARISLVYRPYPSISANSPILFTRSCAACPEHRACARPSQSQQGPARQAHFTRGREEEAIPIPGPGLANMTHSSGKAQRRRAKTKDVGKPTMYLTCSYSYSYPSMDAWADQMCQFKISIFLSPGTREGGFNQGQGRTFPTGQPLILPFRQSPLSREQMDGQAHTLLSACLPALSLQRDPLRAFTGRGLDYSKSRSRHPQIIRTTGLR